MFNNGVPDNVLQGFIIVHSAPVAIVHQILTQSHCILTVCEDKVRIGFYDVHFVTDSIECFFQHFLRLLLILYKICQRRSEEHTSELQSRGHLVCRLLLEKKKINKNTLQNNYNFILSNS